MGWCDTSLSNNVTVSNAFVVSSLILIWTAWFQYNFQYNKYLFCQYQFSLDFTEFMLLKAFSQSMKQCTTSIPRLQQFWTSICVVTTDSLVPLSEFKLWVIKFLSQFLNIFLYRILINNFMVLLMRQIKLYSSHF